MTCEQGSRARRSAPLRVYRKLRRLGWRSRALTWEVRLRLRNRLGRAPKLNGRPGVIVSLTSHRARLAHCFLTLETVFDQEIQPEGVELNLAAEDLAESDLPASIQRLRRRGLRVRFVTPDYKSGNKLIPSYAVHPDHVLVTADDDCLYPSDWLSQLLTAHEQTPGTIICHRGFTLRRNGNGDPVPYRQLMRRPGNGTTASFAVMATGVSGVLYPPYALHPRVHDHALMMRLCPSEDDIWFKAMSLLQGTPTRRVSTHNRLWLQVRGSQKVRLFDHNVRREGISPSDICLRRICDAFKLHDYLDDTTRKHTQTQSRTANWNPGAARPNETPQFQESPS